MSEMKAAAQTKADAESTPDAPAIAATANGVGICFVRGASLPDPKEIPRGTGKQTRSPRLDTVEDLTRDEVEDLIAAANSPVEDKVRNDWRAKPDHPLCFRETAAATKELSLFGGCGFHQKDRFRTRRSSHCGSIRDHNRRSRRQEIVEPFDKCR